VGWIEVGSARAFPLAPYPPQAPRGGDYGDQVWVPAPTWSPDSRFVALTIHGEEPGRPAEESRVFEVWVLDLENIVRARLTRSVGMWSTPRWSPEREGESTIAYAEAHTPSNSYESRYVLKVMDRDGSNKDVVFPAEGQAGITRPVIYDWSPDGRQLVVLYLGDLYLIDPSEGKAQQLTGDGQSTHLDWAQ
jgi:Tol biopolymer transport system component